MKSAAGPWKKEEDGHAKKKNIDDHVVICNLILYLQERKRRTFLIQNLKLQHLKENKPEKEEFLRKGCL